MTVPGGGGGLKTPTVPGSASTGPTLLQVTVRTVDPTAKPPIAVCVPTDGREIPVRIDLQRGKGSIPAVNERWVIDKSMGVWTFACFIGGSPTGAAQFDLTAVSGLPDTLSGVQDSLAAHDDRLNTMWSQGTVTATQGTTADIALTDGTVTTGVQTVGAYYPTVGDTVWTGQVDAAGARVALGTSASGSSSQKMANWTATFDSTNQSIFTTGAGGSGIRSNGLNLEIVPGNTPTAPYWSLGNDGFGHQQIVSATGGAGIVAAGNVLYAVLAANTANHAPLIAQTVGTTAGQGVNLTSDTANQGMLQFPGQNLSMVGQPDGIHVANGANTAYANLLTGPLTVSGVVTILGGQINMGTGAIYAGHGAFTDIATSGNIATGTFNSANGAGITGTVFSTSASTTGAVPVAQQILTQDLSASRNIAVGGTLFYPGGTLPASERSLKDHIEDLGDPWPFLMPLVPARFTWKDQEHHDDQRHVGLYVDEVAEADPDAIKVIPAIPSGMFGLDEDGEPLDALVERHNRNRGRYPDERALIAYLVKACQDLQSRVVELEAVSDQAPPTKE